MAYVPMYESGLRVYRRRPVLPIRALGQACTAPSLSSRPTQSSYWDCDHWVTPASTTAAQSTWPTGVPSPWWAEARTKTLQSLLNAELQKFGCAGGVLSVDGLMGPRSCGTIAWVNKASQSAQAPLAASFQAFWREQGAAYQRSCTLTGGWKEPACPLPTPAAPPAPEPPPAAQIRALQVALNTEVLVPRGFVALDENGTLDAETCGAAAQVYTGIQQGVAKVSEGLAALVSDPAMQTACMPLKPWAAPVKATVTPPPTAPPTAPPVALIEPGLVGNLQRLLNQELDARGYQPLAVTSVIDGPTCGALALAVAAGQAKQLTSAALAAELNARGGMYITACQSVPAVAPTPKAAPAPAPSPAPAPAPAPKPKAKPRPPAGLRFVAGTRICEIRCGDNSDALVGLQIEINKDLRRLGYKPIPTTGRWDKRTSGAAYELARHGVRINVGALPECKASTKGGISVIWPDTCPGMIRPEKKAKPKPKPEPKPTPVEPEKRASMLGWGLGLAAVAAGGYYLLKKKAATG